jgi:hypothetical protein
VLDAEPVLPVPVLPEPVLPEPVLPAELEAEPLDPDEEVVAVGFCEAWASVVVALPWVLSAATTENAPVSPTAPTTTQRLIRESSLRPRSRLFRLVEVMASMIGAGCERPLSP